MEQTRHRSPQSPSHLESVIERAPGDAAPDMTRLTTLARLARELHAGDVEREVSALAERVAEARFHVAVLGQFKRGKSSLINALVGRSILPTGIAPITAIPTVVRYAKRLTARIQFGAHEWTDVDPAELERFVSEQFNPENRLGVTGVEVGVPVELLASGMCLVDTPGVGSVFAGNTAATQAFLPHVDVALILIGVDPPLTADELSLVETVAKQAPVVLVALNKADRFRQPERLEAAAFAERALTARLARTVGPVFHVSAAEQLRGVRGDRSGAEGDGWDALTSTLSALQRDAGLSLVRQAYKRGVERVIRRLGAEIEERRAVLTQPIEQSEQRVALLKAVLDDIGGRLGELAHVLTAEQERLEEVFERRRKAFLAVAIPSATRTMREALAAAADGWGPTLRASAFTSARKIARDVLEPWLAAEQKEADQAYCESMARFVAQANRFLTRMQEIQPTVRDRLPDALPRDAGFRVPSRYYYRDLAPLVQGSPLRTLLDVGRSPSRLRLAIAHDAGRYLAALLEMNSTLVQNDISDRTLESRRRLEMDLRALLAGVKADAERALASARLTQASGAAAVQASLDFLSRARVLLDESHEEG